MLEIDIIFFDMMRRLFFYLRFLVIYVVVECGVYFEIIYLIVLWSLLERIIVLFIVMDFVIFIKGKNIIIMSGVEDVFDFCGFYDIVNLGMFFKLKEE